MVGAGQEDIVILDPMLGPGMLPELDDDGSPLLPT
jgi:hypothetical protein